MLDLTGDKQKFFLQGVPQWVEELPKEEVIKAATTAAILADRLEGVLKVLLAIKHRKNPLMSDSLFLQPMSEDQLIACLSQLLERYGAILSATQHCIARR